MKRLITLEITGALDGQDYVFLTFNISLERHIAKRQSTNIPRCIFMPDLCIISNDVLYIAMFFDCDFTA